MNIRVMVAAAFGLVMVLTATDKLLFSVCAALVVLAGLRFRVFVTPAVLFVIGVLALGDASPVLAMVSGLAAVAYLLAAYPLRWPPEVDTVRSEVIVPALVFGCAALLATAVPVGQSPWLPMAVPVAVVLIYVLVLRPLTQGNGGAVER